MGKFDSYPSGTSPNGTEELIAKQAGATVRLTVSQVLANLGTPASGVATNLTGTALGLTAGNIAPNGAISASSLLLTPLSGPNQAIATLQSVAGGNGSSILQANQINILSDNFNAGSNPGTAGFAVNHTLGGTSMQGGRNAISGTINLTSASASANPLKEYVAITGNATASANDGGTSGSPAGAVYASAFVAVATSAATNLVGVKGSESGVAVQTTTGNAPKIVANWSLVQLGTHAAPGKTYDASLMLSNAGGIGMLNGISFNSSSGSAPVATTGTLISTQDSATVAKGIDFTSYTFSGNAISTPGFSVSGTGAVSGKFIPAAGSFVAGQSYYDGALGNVVVGNTGSASDYALSNPAGNVILTIPTGTADLLFNGAAGGKSTFTNGLFSKSPTAGVGYATGAGSTGTQATNKSTTVVPTNNCACGQITMSNAALAGGTIVSFAFTNTAIAATDVLVLNHISGGTIGAYSLNAQCGAGTATINVRNNTGGSLSDAIVIQFAIIKGVNS